MSVEDNLYVVVSIATIIFFIMAIAFVWSQVFPRIAPDMPNNTAAQLNATFVKTAGTVDVILPVLFWIFAALIIGATAFLAPNPFLLVVWIIVNIVFLFAWDIIDGVLTFIQATPFGVIGGAVLPITLAFFHNDLPKDIIIVNFFIAAVLLAKRVYFP